MKKHRCHPDGLEVSVARGAQPMTARILDVFEHFGTTWNYKFNLILFT